jgi:hypothetical protein
MNKRIYILALIIMAFGCKKPYLPKIIAVSSNYLVVEGVINTGSDSTSIRLSRTVPLSSTTQTKPELGAAVAILTDAGGSYPLLARGNGYYTGAGLNSGTPAKYGLKIITSDGKMYLSDLVPSQYSPPIDSVYYHIQNDGVQIYADTHDPASRSTYYRWDYQETYKFHPAFQSLLYFLPPRYIEARDTTNQVYSCWLTDTGSNIVLNSSAKLTKDIITNNLLTEIPSTSEKIEDRYSILVKQYGLTPDAFNYYQLLKKNTEQVGSIFDVQPSELPGNIHCVNNPKEPVIGYITAGNVSQTRIFIDNRSLPAWSAITPYKGCMMDTLLFRRPIGASFVDDVKIYIWSGLQIPISEITSGGSATVAGSITIDGYTGSLPSCVDCTLRGTSIQPGFWK